MMLAAVSSYQQWLATGQAPNPSLDKLRSQGPIEQAQVSAFRTLSLLVS